MKCKKVDGTEVTLIRASFTNISGSRSFFTDGIVILNDLSGAGHATVTDTTLTTSTSTTTTTTTTTTC
ncbi:hypothetical protein M0802_002932 [Mischocyttarus mexicanus]|nr:hypothetical protein M0802_002932 [Mischocyttarus mexicanus]